MRVLTTATLPLLFIALVASLGAQQTPGFTLVDVTASSGIRFTHNNGAFGRKYLPETLGSGAAFLDYDNDGRQDVLLVNGTSWPGQAGSKPTPSRLYRNEGSGRFTDVTRAAGLEADLYGMGAAAADYDNDGWEDVFITAVGQSHLFRNSGKGGFVDVTANAGLGKRQGFSTSALWFDYDRDGWLDLLVCNYVKWTPDSDVFCSVDGKQKSYCTPEAYRGTTTWLFRNRHDGTFEDVTAKAGLFDATSKSLGVTLLDYDLDVWPDLFVANDTQPNKLYRNNGNGTFTELGLKAGLAFSEEGRARAGMGVDAVDLDGSGRPAVAVTNFSGEMLGLFRAESDGQYVDRAPGSDIGRATRQTLGWGCFFFDVDLDGQQDLLVVNGRLDAARVANGAPADVAADTPHLFLNASGRFTDIAREAGATFASPKMGRGAAFADIDSDGDLDTVITTNGGPVHLYRTDLAAGNRSVRLRLVGTASNRDGIGARATVRVGKASASRVVRTGSSYLSQSELPLTFGLGTAAKADDVTIVWP